MSFTSKEFWRRHAHDFNFDLNEEELLKKGLERGFIVRAGTRTQRVYRYNPDYKSVTAKDVNEIIRDNGTDASETVQALVDEELYGNHYE